MELDLLLEEELKRLDNYENYKKEIVTKVAYLIGVKDEHLHIDGAFDLDVLKEIDANASAKVFRALSIVRVDYIRNFKEITNQRKNLIPMEELATLVDVEKIKFLRDKGFETVLYNQSMLNHIAYVNQYILDNIEKIKGLFPSWVRWDYLKTIFTMPGCYAGSKGSLLSGKNSKVINSINKMRVDIGETYSNFFPFQTYIYWNIDKVKPYYGNILFNDAKFLTLLYSQFGDTFHATDYVIDATKEDKESIYDFVDDANNIAVIVDCENVDPFRFASVFLGLEEENLAKIKKVILYDDVHTSEAWDYINELIKLPIEHIEIERLLDNKSLVDVTMTAGACKEFYKDGTESLILASSDSDFWALIKNLPDARFYVLNESDKTSDVIINKLDEYNISYCNMDSFAQCEVQEFKDKVLLRNLRSKMFEFNETGELPTTDMMELVDIIYDECFISGSKYQMENEKKAFFDKYIKKNLRASVVEENGKFTFKMELVRK